MGMPIINQSGITRENAITDIIKSIALIEAALSHIINAEGEKIQAITGTLPTNSDSVIAQSPEDLLTINKSVEEMVSSITNLEIILHKKLSSVYCDCNN